MASNTTPTSPPPRLTGSGVGRLATVFGTLLVEAGLFFGSAGTLDWFRGWLYYGGLLAYLAASVPAMFVFFPGAIEVVNERGRFKPDVKAWDKAFAIAYVVLLVVEPVVAGWDAVRVHGSAAPAWLAWPALAVTILAYGFVHWAMVVNTFAETGVRIQTDRHQEVVSTGPYGIVRHPFYISLIVTQAIYPLALGSLWAYLPALAIAGLFVWRAVREDAVLQAELPGYAAYAARVRYRLLPGVW